MAKRPTITIEFEQLASSLVTRSGQSTVVLMLKKEEHGKIFKICSDITEITSDDIGTDAYNAARFAFANYPQKIVITDLTFTDIVQKLVKNNIVNAVFASIEDGSDFDVETIMSVKESKGYAFYAVDIVNTEKPTIHNTHYIAVGGSKYAVYSTDEDDVAGEYDLRACYAGAIAVCGTDRSLANYTLPLVASVESKWETNFEGMSDPTENGILFAEMTAGEARVVAGVNTAETGNGITEDMQRIEVVQTMDMLSIDIADTFVNYYRGKYKNTYDNQLLLIAAINGYFDDLESEEVLDGEFDNVCDIDVQSQRSAWLASGKSDAESWSDDKVKSMAYKTTVFLTADVKIAQSMENLQMKIALE